MYSELISHYTKEYEKYVNMGLSREDALTLIEKHIKKDANIKKASPYDLINLFAGEDVWKKTFEAYNNELNILLDRISQFMVGEENKVSADTLSQCDAPLVEKKECDCVKKEEHKTCECAKTVKDGVTEIISNTPKHKEFRVTYPNGYYKYKMLVK